MRLGITLRIDGQPHTDLALEAERLGYHSVWCGESYGTDAVSPVAWVLARTTRIQAGTGIMQMPARTPACAAMTAMTLQALSGDRFLCGVGPSGPQVVEGWHGQPYGTPMERTREYIGIIRSIVARERPLEHQGDHYRIPYDGPGATGLGKPLKSILHAKPLRFYCASITPGGMRLAGEIADGNLPIFMSPEGADIVVKPTLEGMAKAGKPADLTRFDIAPYTRIRMGDDLQACRDACKPDLALYIGGMGAKGRNFYNDYCKRLGYPDAAVAIQDAFLAKRHRDAAALVPDKLVDEIALVGPPDRIRGRLKDWQAVAKDGKVGTLVLAGPTPEAMRVVAEAVL
ncbi:LLM class F420-dependent oxidoreductase [Paracraurococcus ruber]|uniref:LLM class F420-dependent oxidoreductase n=1 Tax=Paracraurococcus ruber TaxID=77675 RepID=A0ABS1CTV6_9PROT|nr:LLM class F420-dependent oxidoreductase [Paracraurococcus ruber]MBK1657710.1 LLM class F420-dependent oxidoreductase [Paracraurococcus ruber]TDG31550.1 LLM class F420-dependent oxidoreductase [Paracraurococcus ruber]